MEFLAQPEILALLFLAALVAGFIDALAGGGGLITLPALLLAQVPPVAALATNKLQASFGTLAASYRMLKSGLVTWRGIRALFLASLIGSVVGTVLVQQLEAGVLDVVIPVILICIALYYLFVPNVTDAAEPRVSETLYRRTVAPLIGFYDGFFGPGTGSLFAFSRNALRGDSLRDSTARAKLMNFASNIASLVVFAVSGQVVWLVGAVMILGSFTGATVASHMIVRGNTQWIRPLLVIMCLAMAGRTIWQNLTG